MAKFPVRVEREYGNERKYIDDPKLAGLFKQLTGRTTLRESDIDALVQLGHQVGEVRVLGRKVS